ncbi:MAG: sulfite exporter TauE/SafE family protein [Alcanivoracaceae bacterium]
MSLALLWLGACILLAYTVEAITGFGSIVIALSLAALVLPLDQVMPILVPLNIVMTGYLSWRLRRQVHWPLLGRLILPLMLLGTALGYGLRPWLGDQLVRMLFGALVVWFAGRSLWAMRHQVQASSRPRWQTRLWIGLAGVTHGLFASGGPLLVYGLTGVALDKARFRATLILVWFSLNSALTLAFAADGSLLPALPTVALYLPLLPLGILLGEWAHQRVDENRFRQLVLVLLLVAGAALLWPR